MSCEEEGGGFHNPQPATRNPQPATHNPQLTTRNSQPATRNPQPATRNGPAANYSRHYLAISSCTHRIPPSWNGGSCCCSLLIFCVPLPLTVLVHFTKGRAGLAGAFSRVVIGGVIDSPSPPAPAPPPLSFAGVRDASYQQAVATSFDTGYPGRDWILRAANEVYLRVFRTGLGGVVIGRGFSAFYNRPPYEFVDEYCVERAAPDALAPLVDDLRRLRDNCRRRGVAFVVVVTPSKTAIYPEELPWSWKRRHRSAAPELRPLRPPLAAGEDSLRRRPPPYPGSQAGGTRPGVSPSAASTGATMPR